MQFPSTLGFNIQTQEPFANDRYYARVVDGADKGFQSFAIADAVGAPITTTTIRDDLDFDDVMKALRLAITVLRTANA